LTGTDIHQRNDHTSHPIKQTKQYHELGVSSNKKRAKTKYKEIRTRERTRRRRRRANGAMWEGRERRGGERVAA
jgi:IS5 family transposase